MEDVWKIADLLAGGKHSFRQRKPRLVDVGTPGMVRPKPPMAPLPSGCGSTLTRTMPTGPTDLDTLAIYSTILQEALVLGHDHLKRTVTNDGSGPSLGEKGPLQSWTSEDTVNYDKLEESDVG